MIFQLRFLSTVTSPQPYSSSCEVPSWRLGKRVVKLSLGIHSFGFNGTCLCALEALLLIFS